MATPLTKKTMEDDDIVAYKDIRDQLKTGQIFFSSGRYLFSGIIQRLTKSVWSHVAIVYKDEALGRVLILEAEPYVGIRLIPLSKYLHDYKGKKKSYKGLIYLADLDQTVDKKHLDKAISFGLDELTRPYDNWEIVRIMLRILFKVGKREQNRSYICSELVRDAFAKAGIQFPLNNTYISPDEIWKDKKVVKKFRIL
jgi:hypothetical protein